MRKIRDYIFYRIYEQTLRKWQKHKKYDAEEVAFNNATYSMSMYFILCVEFVFYVLLGIIEFDMNPVRDFYLTYKIEIVAVFIIAALIETYFIDKMYKKKIATGWIDELKLKYHKEKYSFSAIWIIVFPFVMFLVIPIIYSLIMGTAQIVKPSTGEIIWSISDKL